MVDSRFEIVDLRLRTRELANLQSKILLLSLFFRHRLGAVHVLVFGFSLGGIEFLKTVGGGGDVVPAAVLKIDQGLAVVIDGDYTADNALKALQFGSLRPDRHILIDPLVAQLIHAGKKIHGFSWSIETV